MSATFSPGIGKFTEDGEGWSTVTERENDVGAEYRATLSADTYVLMVSLLNPNFPHNIQGQSKSRLDLTSLYLALDLSASAKGSINYGVITRIDGTDGDIEYFFSVPFLTGAAAGTLVYILRGVPSQVKLDILNGVLQHVITNDKEANVAAVNTVITLNGPLADVTPGLGDFIIKIIVTTGTINMSQGVFYHSH